MVSKIHKTIRTNKQRTNKNKNKIGGGKISKALGAFTLGASLVPGAIYGATTGQKTYYDSANYVNADAIVKDLSTIKKTKTIELMQIWASEKGRRWFGVYRWADKIFNGIEEFIKKVIDGKIKHPESDINSDTLTKYKMKFLFRIALGMTFLLCIHANLSRDLIQNFITEINTIEKQTKPDGEGKGGTSKSQIRETIIKKIIDLVNNYIKDLNKNRVKSKEIKFIEINANVKDVYNNIIY
jgi:hypothetical protein